MDRVSNAFKSLQGHAPWGWLKNEDNRPKVKLLLRSGAVVIAVALVASMNLGAAGSSAATSTYRESTVTRGDITVGITESTSATLENVGILFGIGAEIEEVYVRAGQAVQEGDPLLKFTAESVQKELTELQRDYQLAMTELNEAQLDKEQGEIAAESDYATAINNSTYAQTTYDIAIKNLELALASAEDNVSSISYQIRVYRKLLSEFNNGYADYSDYYMAEQDYNNAKAALTTAQNALDAYISDPANSPLDTSDPDYKDLAAAVTAATRRVNSTKLAYEDAGEIFDESFLKDIDTDSEDALLDAKKTAEAKLIEAEIKLEEAKMNLAKKAVEAEIARKSSVLKGNTAKSSYDIKMQQLANAVTSKELAVEALAQELSEKQPLLENNIIYAPHSGIVTQMNYKVGDTLGEKDNAIYVSNNSALYVSIAVSQDEISSVQLDQEATITMDAFESLVLEGFVNSISTTPARNVTGTASYTVTIKAQGEGVTSVYEGMTGSVTIVTARRQNVLQVSNRAVYTEGGKSYVKIKNADGTLAAAEVVTGFSDGRNVEIVSGLSEGDTYIIESQVSSR